MRKQALALTIVLTACAGAGVVPPETTTPSVSRVLDGTLVAGALARPSRTVAHASGPPQVAQIALMEVQSGDARLDRAERHLVRLLERSGLASQVLMEADLGPQGAQDPAFVVSYRLLNFQSTFHGPDGRWWTGAIIGGLTAGLGWLIAIESHQNFTHNFEFEVRVYDVRGAPVVRANEGDGTIVNRYDTSVAAPLVRRTYSGEMRTWIGAGTGGPSGRDLQTHLDEQGAAVAQIMYDLSIEDVASALRRGIAQPPPPSSEPSAPAPPATDAASRAAANEAEEPEPPPPAWFRP